MRPTLFYSSKILHNIDPVNPLAMKSKEKYQWPNLGKFKQFGLCSSMGHHHAKSYCGQRGFTQVCKRQFGVSSTLLSIKVSFITKTTKMLDIC
jgi:hypothetical protein